MEAASRRAALAALACLALVALGGCEREPQAAIDGPSVAKSGCLGCHAPDKGLVFAPSFAAISERYAGNSDAAALLAESLKNGSHGKWGSAAMPAQSQLSEEEAKALVRSILRQ
jgi:cytochrome c